MNIISIVPVSIWTTNGVKNAVKFQVDYITYNNNGLASANTKLLDSQDMELTNQVVFATAAQTALWSDDVEFYKTLAQNAGLTPN
jgi:hypothetical protein